MSRSSTISISRKVLLALCLCVGLAFAQNEPPRRQVPQRTGPISFESLPVFSSDTAAALINIHYRIRKSFFVILRNIESLRSDDFLGKGELLIELWDEKGVAVARHMRSIQIRLNKMPGEDDPSADLQGSATFSVPTGTYFVFFNVEDRQSERSFTSRNTKVMTRPPLDHFDISAPVFVSGPPVDRTFKVLNQGTDVYFGERGGVMVPVLLPSASTAVTARYELSLTADRRGLEPFQFSRSEAMVLDGIPILNTSTDTLGTSSRSVEYSVVASDPRWKTLYVPLPLEKLQPGRAKLKLEITADGLTRTAEPKFRVVWLNQPLSLRDPDISVDALQHIAQPDEMDALRSSSESRATARLLDFWRKKDPDTTTAYNEVMVEYYRRVDAAIRQYSTPNETNGYLTDRGRIYILYGSPVNNERVFSPTNPPREVWTYASVKRRFIFEDRRRNGLYTLIAVEDL